MQRLHLYQLGPQAYALSRKKEILKRKFQDQIHQIHFAQTRSEALLPVVVNRHNSLIRRKLGNVDQRLQENKAVNLSLAAPKLTHLLIQPGETFSFWHCVGECTAEKGYREGLTISGNHPSSGIGGGMCQMTNLIHWMVLHSDLDIIEHHHHDGMDLFPDYGRQIPFGTGTSILYNYLDYRFQNNTDRTYQLTVWTDGEYLHGELLADRPQQYSYHIECRNEFFSREEDGVYRNNEIWRHKIDVHTGEEAEAVLLRRNHAKIAYDPAGLTVVDLRKEKQS